MLGVNELKEIAIKCGTPSYIFDTDELCARIDAMQQILGCSLVANRLLETVLKVLAPCIPSRPGAITSRNVQTARQTGLVARKWPTRPVWRAVWLFVAPISEGRLHKNLRYGGESRHPVGRLRRTQRCSGLRLSPE